MRKRIWVFSLLILCLLSACSVQETMSPEIFIERLEVDCSGLDYKNAESFYESDKYVCFIKNESGIEFMFEITPDERGNAQKISLACSKTDKTADFISVAESIIRTYAPEDDSKEIVSSIFSDGKVPNEFSYFDTQWHYYTCAASDSAFYFSAESKKLAPEKDAEMTLKPNDIDITKGSD